MKIVFINTIAAEIYPCRNYNLENQLSYDLNFEIIVQSGKL